MNADTHSIRLAIVGHANAGKTSLMRTLLRDAEFGEVADYAGTTRHVEGTAIQVDGQNAIELFDTPGLEDSMALLEAWQDMSFAGDLSSPAEKMRYFVDLPQTKTDFEQECKVLQQALLCDVMLYVIDVRESCLGKYQDEIALLLEVGKPIIPVLNFTQEDTDNSKRWREQLVRYHMHAVVEYDTVAFTFEAEKRLYQKLQGVLEPHYKTIQRVIEQNQKMYLQRQKSSVSTLARLLIDVGAYRIRIDSSHTADVSVERLQDKVRDAEQACIVEFLAIWGFDKDDVRNEFLPIINGRWQYDLFDPKNITDWGLQTGSDAAKGAAVGIGVDIIVGGLSLGAGAALGALVGTIWGTVRRHGDNIWSKLSGVQYICVDETTLKLLWLRQWHLLNHLLHRGHATQQAIELDISSDAATVTAWKRWLRVIRTHPQWSGLMSGAEKTMTFDNTMYDFQQKLADELLVLMRAEHESQSDEAPLTQA